MKTKSKMSMGKRLAIVLVAGLVLAWMLGAFRREPLHKGKPVSYWVDAACLGFDGNSSWTNRTEVRNIGPIAIPYLVKKLQTTDRWRDTWNSWRKKLPASWQARYPEKKPAKEIHYGAARTLAMFGAEARPAAADLARLLPELKDPALQVLAVIGPDAKMALPALHEMLTTNKDVNVRVEIARALWKIGRETNVVLDICTNAMLGGNSLNAPNVLGEMKTAAAPAAPVALSVLQDTNRPPGMRANSAILLGYVHADTPEVRAALLAGTRDGTDENFHANCAMALWQLDPQYAGLATRLVIEEIVVEQKQFPSNDQNIAMWLEYRELDPRGALPTLKELAGSGSEEVRKAAVAQIAKVEEKLKAAPNPAGR